MAKRVSLATEALRLSMNNQNSIISAQAHTFLGELLLDAGEISQSKNHFLQASLIYKHINDKSNQIISSISYADTFIIEKKNDKFLYTDKYGQTIDFEN